MVTPKARGGLSDQVFAALRDGAPGTDAAEAHITLWALYEQHYRGFGDVDVALEWHPTLIALRGELEEWFAEQLMDRFVPPASTVPLAEAFFTYVEGHEGPSIATYVQREASSDEVLDLLRARSLYQLHEADPTTWAVPRLPVRPQVALMALQYDEYGGGNRRRQHAQLFRGMEARGLDPAFGAYVDDAPVDVLAQNNAMSLFGLHRRWRGAAVGHLAAFEAEAVHEPLAVREICLPLVADEPALVDGVFHGAFTCLDLEARTAQALLDAWAA